jgi:hypothetical protein
MGHRSTRHPKAQAHIVVYREAVPLSGVILIQRPSVLFTRIVDKLCSFRDTDTGIAVDDTLEIGMVRGDMA